MRDFRRRQMNKGYGKRILKVLKEAIKEIGFKIVIILVIFVVLFLISKAIQPMCLQKNTATYHNDTYGYVGRWIN